MKDWSVTHEHAKSSARSHNADGPPSGLSVVPALGHDADPSPSRLVPTAPVGAVAAIVPLTPKLSFCVRQIIAAGKKRVKLRKATQGVGSREIDRLGPFAGAEQEHAKRVES